MDSPTPIHPTAFVHPDARIGANTTIGAFVVIEAGAAIGEGCEIGHHVTIRSGVHIGDRVRIDDGTSIGKQPMRAPNSAVTADRLHEPTRIGDRCLVGTHAVVYAGCTLGDRVLVADLATIREEVTIGKGTIVGRGVAVENRCRIGAWCKLETGAYITAYSDIEDRVFVAPGVLTSNDNFLGRTEARFEHFRGVTVRRGGRIGVGAVILPGRTIGPDAVVGAGAVLTGDADGERVYVGIPARSIRDVPEEQKLDNQGWSDD